jgi:hypothetical protein
MALHRCAAGPITGKLAAAAVVVRGRAIDAAMLEGETG